MGTTKETNRSRDGKEEVEIIPWKFVPYRARQELIKKLNPEATISGNDWRMLAGELGFDISDITFIESEKDNNTKVLFSQYDTKPEASFNAVKRSLIKMQRQDCVDILNNALSEIKQAYDRARELQMFHVAETSDVLKSVGQCQWPSTCPCTYSPHSTSVCGNQTYCPYGHGFNSCGCAGHSNHLGHSPFHSRSLLPHPDQSTCQNFNQLNASQKICVPGLSSPFHTSPVHCSIMKESCSCHDRAVQSSPSAYGPRGNSPASRLKMPGNHNNQNGMSPVHMGYQGSPFYNFNDIDGVYDELVERDTLSLQYQSLLLTQQSNGSLYNNVVARDITTSVPETLLMAQGNSSSSLSTNTSSRNGLKSRHKVIGQSSDDCNITPDLSTDTRFTNDGSRSRGIVGNLQGSVLQGVTGHDGNNVRQPRNDQSPKYAQHHYMDHRDGHYQQDGQVKTQNVNSNEEGKNTVACGGSLPWDRSHLSSTFPMTEKAKQDHFMEDLTHLTISKKATSVPPDMKPRECRKVLRLTKVFVTYSFDSEIHARQVLSLCKFLQVNGFACCVDVSEAKNVGKPLGLLEWCRSKVAEANFILACISKKYLEDIASNRQHSSSNTSNHQLHTREIYELMTSKHHSGQFSSLDGSGNSISPYFIPLLFPGMTLNRIPQWLMSEPTYKWPEQYKDLACMLTKPEERMRAKRQCVDNLRGYDQEEAAEMDKSYYVMDIVQ